MRSLIWLRKLFSWVLGHLGWGGAARADKPPRRDDFVPLFVTRLEERRVLSTITVTGTGDDVVNGDGEVTLREAITAANTDTSVDGSTAGSGNDEIVFDASLAGQTITLDGNQLPTITGANGDLTITGLGARLLSIDGDGLSRILEVSVGANVEVSGLTLTGGNSGNVSGGAILSAGDLTITASQIENNTAETAGGGGGIFSNNAVLTIVDTTISGNTSNGTGAGGGIYNNGGTLTVINSTISGNQVTGGDFGGGIFNDGTATITNSTIVDNSSGASGGGIRNHIGDTLTLQNTIISGNTRGGSADDLSDAGSGTATANFSLIQTNSGFTLAGGSGDNIFGTDPQLGSLQDNGGPTDTHATQSGSPVVDAGSNTGVAATDQRGFVRIADGDGNSTATVDIGAYEFQPTAFSSFAVLPTQNGTGDLTVGDFNNDGILDVAADYNGTAFPSNSSIFAVFLGIGAGSFGAPTLFNPGTGGCFTGGGLETADFNGDGNLDLVMTHGGSGGGCFGNKVTVHLGDGTGSFNAPPIQFTSGGSIGNLAVGDFNGDTFVDLAIPSSDSQAVFIHRGVGDGTFLAPSTVAVGESTNRILTSDVNNDGDLDLIVTTSTRAIVYLGNGNGTFAAPSQLLVTNARSSQTGDFDEDGIVDLAVTSSSGGTVSIFRGTGGGNFAAATALAAGTSPASFDVADFDGDGHLDLAVGSSTTDNISVLSGDGGGGFGSPVTFAAGANPGNRIVAADFNGDGLADLSATSGTPAGVSILLNQLASPVTFTTPVGNSNLELRVVGEIAQIVDLDTGTVVSSRALIATSEITINGTNAGDDLLTINTDDFDDRNITFTFNAGTGGNDALTFTGTAGSVTHIFDNANDGSAIIVDGGNTLTINYIGLEPIIDSTVVADRVFTFSGGVDNIVLSNDATPVAGSGRSFIDSNLSESVAFANPTNLLTINAGGGSDTIDVQGLDSAFDASIFINGDGDTDTITFSGATAPTDGSITVAAENVNVNQTITLTSGSFESTGTTFNSTGGAIVSASGNVTINHTGTVDLPAVTLANGTLNVTAAGVVTQDGVLDIDGTTSITAGAANNVTLANTSNDFAGAVSIVSGDDVELADTNAIDFGASTVSGTLDVTADEVVVTGAVAAGAVDFDVSGGAGNITDTGSGALTVTGTTTLRGQAGDDITLDGANDFQGAVGVTQANNVVLNDTNSLTLAAIVPQGNVTVTAGADLTIGGNVTKSAGADATATFRADNSIIVNGSVQLTSSNNELNVVLNSDRDASGAGAVALGDSALINSNNGDITIGGGANPLTTAARGTATNIDGVFLDKADLISGTGNISVRGQGAVVDQARGINARGTSGNGALIQSTTGNITLVGTGGSGGDRHEGVEIFNSPSAVTSTNGDITITGVGGSTGTLSRGVAILIGAFVESTGNGDIVINGTSGAASAHGFVLDNSDLGAASGTGNITITADDILIDGAPSDIRGTGTLTIQPGAAATTIGLAGGTGTFNLDAAELGVIRDGFASIIIGAANAGAVDINAFTFLDPVTILGGVMTVTGLEAGANDITLTSTGTIDEDANDTVADITTTGTLTLTAGGAIGDDADTTNAPLDIAVGTLVATTTAAGEIFIRDTGGLTIQNVSSNDGNIFVQSTAGVTVTNAAANSDLTLIADTGDLDVATVSAAGGILTLTATDGAITDGNGGTNNVTAANLVATAATGIDLDTNVDTIVATTTASGAIDLNETDGVTLGNISAADSLILTAAGNVAQTAATAVVTGTATGGAATFNLGAANNLTLGESGNDFTGVVTVTNGNNVVLNDTNDLTLGAVTTQGTFAATAAGLLSTSIGLAVSSGGTQTLQADNMDLDGAVTATGQRVVLRSTTAGDAINLGSTTDAAANTLELSADELARVTADTLEIGSATSGTVTLSDDIAPNVTSLRINSDENFATTATANVITVDNLAVEVDGNIGVSTSIRLATNVTNIALDSEVSGDIFLAETVGGLTVTTVDGLTGITTTASDIDITVVGDANLEEAIVAGGSGDVTITTTAGGDVNVNSVTADGDTVSITAAGAINELGADGTADIVAATIDLNAVSGVGDAAQLEITGATITIDSSGVGDVDVDNLATAATTVNSLTAGTGTIQFDQIGVQDLTIAASSTADGDITITGGADVNVNSVAADGNLVTVTAAGAINESGADGTADIVAATIDLNAATGIGSAAQLEITGTTLTIDSTTGNIDVENQATAESTVTSLKTGTGFIQFDQIGTQVLNITDAETSNGGITITNAARFVRATRVVAGGTGDIFLQAVGAQDVLLGEITAIGNQVAVRSGGNIDVINAASKVTADELLLRSPGGIGQALAPIRTAVALVAAQTASDGIFITDDDAIEVTQLTDAVGTVTGLLKTGSNGDIVLLSGNGNITLSQAISANAAVDTSIVINAGTGEITSAAAATIATNNGDVTLTSNAIDLGANVSSAAGSLALQTGAAGRTIGLGGTATGDYNVDATELGFLVNGFTSITIGAADAGVVDINAFTFLDPVTILGGVMTVTGLEAGANDITLTSTGTIDEDANDTVADITTTGTLTLTAGGAIGDDADTTDAPLDIAVGTLVASTTAAGEIFIRDTGGLTIQNVSSNNGNIFVQSTAAVTVTNAVANSDLTLIADTGNLAVTAVSAAGGTATLTATAGAITDDNGAAINVTAANLAVTSVTGVDLDIDATTLAVENSGAGGVNVTDTTNGLTVGSVTSGAGTVSGVSTVGGGVTIVANSPLTISEAVADTGGGNIVLTATDDGAAPEPDNLTIGANVTASGGNGSVTLSGENLILNNGVSVSVIGAGTVTANISNATTLNATATVQSAGGTIIVNTDDIAINTTSATINAGAGIVTVRNTSANRQIDLGTNTTGQLSLTDAELDRITAGRVRVGRNDANQSGAITISDAIDNTLSFSTLHLITGSTVDDGATGSIVEISLAVEAGGDVTLDNVANNVNSIAIQTAGNVAFTDAGSTSDTAFGVGGVDGVSGVGTTSGSVTLRAVDKGIGISNNVDATTTIDVTLDAVNSRFAVAADIESTGGTHTYTADIIDVQVAGSITATGQTVQIRSTEAGDAIDLGSTTDVAADTLELSDAELDRIDADLVVVGTANAGAATVTSALTLTNNLTVETGADTITVNDTIDGNVDLTLNTTGTTDINAELGGNNALASLTTNALGTTQLDADITAQGGTLTFNDNVELTNSIALTDTGGTGLTFNGTVNGPFNLTLNIGAQTTFVGTVGNTAAIGTGSAVTPAIDINSTGNTLFGQTVQTAGGIVQNSGAGEVTFRGNVTTGGTTDNVFDENVALENLTFMSNGNVTFGDAAADTLTINAGGVEIDAVTNNSTLTINAATLLNQDLTLTVSDNASTISGIISGAAGLLKDSVGQLTLSAANTYQGLTTVIAGTLNATNNASLGTDAAGTLVQGGATLNLSGINIGNESLTLNGTGVGGNGALTATGTSLVTGTVDLNTTSTVSVVGAGDELTLSGVVSGAGLNKAGAGTLILSGNNDYIGTTDITTGTLRTETDTALGTDAGGTIVQNGATLTVVTADIGNENLTLNGSGVAGVGALNVLSNTLSGGAVTLAADTTVNVDAGFTLTLNGAIGETGGARDLTKTGNGVLDLNAVNTYTGTTIVDAGTLIVDGTTTAASNVNVNNDATLAGIGTVGGTVDVTGTGQITPATPDATQIPGVLTIGGLNYSGGNSTSFDVDLLGTAPGNTANDHDQLIVTGSIDLNDAVLNREFDAFTPTAGDQFVILRNDQVAGTFITGTFAGLAENTVITDFGGVVGLNARITYRGGDGNDVALNVQGGVVVVSGANAGAADDFTIRRNDTNIEVFVGMTLFDARSISSGHTIQVVGENGQNDAISVVLTEQGTNNNFLNDFTGAIEFDGGTGGDDLLIITNDDVTSGSGIGGAGTDIIGSIVHQFDSETTGSVTIDDDGVGAGGSFAITYTGLEPIDQLVSVDNLTLNYSNNNDTITLADAAGRTAADSDFGEIVTFVNPGESLTVNSGDGNDVITVEPLDTGFDASLTINGQTGTDTVNLNTDLTLGSGAAGNTGNLSVTASTINVAVDVAINTTAATTGAVSLTASRDIVLNTGSSITTLDGDISLLANQAGTTAGDFTGITLTNADITTGSGATNPGGTITLDGQGASTGLTDLNRGVVLQTGSTITSTGTGAGAAAITISGTGGAGDDDNQGVRITGANTLVTSVEGDITITGTGGSNAGADSDNNRGVEIDDQAVVSSTGQDLGGATAALITITGTGGGGRDNNDGVRIDDANTLVTSVDGDIVITGTGGSNGAADSALNFGVNIASGTVVSSTGVDDSGTGRTAALVTITGTGADSIRGTNVGVEISGAATLVTSVDGDITITGEGGNGASSNFGVNIIGSSVSSTGQDLPNRTAALVTIRGTGGTGDDANIGVFVQDAQVTSVDGDLTILGTARSDGSAGSENNLGVFITNDSMIASMGQDVAGRTAALVTITGTGGAGNNGNEGVRIDGAGTQVASIDGDIAIAGTGGTNGLAGSSLNHGVEVSTGAAVGTTGVGNIAITGTRAGTDNAIQMSGNAIIGSATMTGTVSLDGNGGPINLRAGSASRIQVAAVAATTITIQDASAVTLSQITGPAAALILGVGQNITGDVTQGGEAIFVDTLTASTAGVIQLDSTTNTVNTVNAITRGGAFTLNDSAGGLTITGPVNTGNTDDELLVDNVTDTGGGSFTFIATSGDIDFSATGRIVTGGGDVSLTSIAGSVTMEDGATVDVGSGTILFEARNGDIQLSGLSTTNTTDVAVQIFAGGAVTDAGDTNVDIDAPNGRLVIESVNGVGTSNAIETTVSSINVDNTMTGNIQIAETDDLEIIQVLNHLSVGSFVHLNVGTGGNGAITDDIPDVPGMFDIVADRVALQATNGIGDVNNPIETQVNVIAALNTAASPNMAAGNIEIVNSGPGLDGGGVIGTVDGLDSLAGELIGVTNDAIGGSITITNASPLTVNAPVLATAGGNISLTSLNDGNLTVNRQVSATGGNGDITLDAGSGILDINDDTTISDLENELLVEGTGTITGTPDGTTEVEDGVFFQSGTGRVSSNVPNLVITPLNGIDIPDVTNIGVAEVNFNFGRAGEENFNVVVEFGVLDASGALLFVASVVGRSDTGLGVDPETFLPTGNGFSLEEEIFFAPGRTIFDNAEQSFQAGNPNPLNASAAVLIRITVINDPNISIGASEVVVVVSAAIPGEGIGAVAVDTTGQVDQLAFPDEADTAATTNAVTPVTLSSQAQQAVQAIVEAALASGRQIIIHPLTPTGDRVVGVDQTPVEIELDETVLNDLTRLFSELPDGRYRIYLREAGEERLRLLFDINVRSGTVTSIEKVTPDEDGQNGNEEEKDERKKDPADEDKDDPTDEQNDKQQAGGDVLPSVMPQHQTPLDEIGSENELDRRWSRWTPNEDRYAVSTVAPVAASLKRAVTKRSQPSVDVAVDFDVVPTEEDISGGSPLSAEATYSLAAAGAVLIAGRLKSRDVTRRSAVEIDAVMEGLNDESFSRAARLYRRLRKNRS